MLFAQHDTFAIFAVLVGAMVLDLLAGDPRWLYRRIPHPVTAIGSLIGRLDALLNRNERKRLRGVCVIAVLIAGAAGVGWGLQMLLAPWSAGLVLEAVTVAIFLAQKDLYDHVGGVALALETGGVEAGREAVSQIVGRDPHSLDEAGLSRAAVESLAENFSDGIVAPAIWYLLFGLPGLLAYKALNTADSMIGHRTPVHEEFGWAAARLDDAANLVPSRFSALLFAGTALFLPGSKFRQSLTAAWRDARHHTSPNAGWPEAALAGALGFALAGPRRYAGRDVDGAWMGNGRAVLGASDIRLALRFARSANIALLLGVVGAAYLWRAI